MDESDPFALRTSPTARRPLLGLTVLAVEDSRFACETMRLMCLRSGARIRRADCLRSARRHLKVYRPSVVIVDMGLPDGRGEDLIRDLNTATPRVSALLGISGDDGAEERAVVAGADGFLSKPLQSLAAFQEAVLAILPETRRPQGLRSVADDQIIPDPATYRDDMSHVADLLDGETDGPMLDYVAQFLGGVARSAHDTSLAEAATRLKKQRATGAGASDIVRDLSQMVRDRIKQKVAI